MRLTNDGSKPAGKGAGGAERFPAGRRPWTPSAVRLVLFALILGGASILVAVAFIPAVARAVPHGEVAGSGYVRAPGHVTGDASRDARDDPVGSVASTPLAERGSIVVGGEPKYLLADPTHNRLFVSDFARESVVVVDLATGLTVRRIAVPGAPAGLALSDACDILFVACYSGSTVVAVDLSSGRVVARAVGLEHPWALATVTGPGGREVLAVTENSADRVTFLGIEGIGGLQEGERSGSEGVLARVGEVATAYYPYHFDVATGILYVVSYGGRQGGRVDAVDLATLARMWKTGTGKGSFDIQVSPEVAMMVVANLSGQSVGLYDLAGKSSGEIGLGADPRCVRFRAGGELLVSLQSADEVRSLDVRQATTAYTVAVGARPGAMTWLSGRRTGPPDDTLAVANQGDGTISLLSPGEPVAEFQDVPADHLFRTCIRTLALRGAVSGYPDPDLTDQICFRPDSGLTRAQMAKVLVMALSLHTEAIDPAAVDYVDLDAEDGVFPFDYVQEATAAGVISGFGGDPPRFGPYEPVTRMQLLRIVVKAAAAVGSPLPAAPAPAPFVDLPSDAADAAVVNTAFAAGLISGVPGADGRLRLMPWAPVTRGQAAKVVYGLLASLHTGDLRQ